MCQEIKICTGLEKETSIETQRRKLLCRCVLSACLYILQICVGDIVFQIIAATEAKTLTELSDAKLRNAMLMLKAFNELDREEKEEIRNFIRGLVVTAEQTRHWLRHSAKMCLIKDTIALDLLLITLIPLQRVSILNWDLTI